MSTLSILAHIATVDSGSIISSMVELVLVGKPQGVLK